MELTKGEGTEDLKLEFAALLLHDLETPIAVTKQFIKRVRENRFQLDNPDHLELLQATEDAISMAERILFDLMDIAKAERERLTAHFAAAAPLQVLERALRVAGVYAEKMGLKLDFEKSADLPGSVTIDEHLTQRIIDNLLINAIRHSPPEETIKISAYEEGEYLFITVANKTTELRPADLKQLFEPFKQVRLRKEKRFRGFGLGLTFARAAATAQGGELTVIFNQNEEVEFSLKLPLRGCAK